MQGLAGAAHALLACVPGARSEQRVKGGRQQQQLGGCGGRGTLGCAIRGRACRARTSAESPEVLGGLGHDVRAQLHRGKRQGALDRWPAGFCRRQQAGDRQLHCRRRRGEAAPTVISTRPRGLPSAVMSKNCKAAQVTGQHRRRITLAGWLACGMLTHGAASNEGCVHTAAGRSAACLGTYHDGVGHGGWLVD